MNELTTNGNVLNDLRKIIEAGRKQAYAAAGQIAVATYWNIGRRIVEEEQNGQERAKYGTKLIANLARQPTLEYGSGSGQRSLEQYRRFYLSFKDMKITNACVRNLMSSGCEILIIYIGWGQIVTLLSVQTVGGKRLSVAANRGQ